MPVVSETKRTIPTVECPHCAHTWEYSGHSNFTTCGKCFGYVTVYYLRARSASKTK